MPRREKGGSSVRISILSQWPFLTKSSEIITTSISLTAALVPLAWDPYNMTWDYRVISPKPNNFKKTFKLIARSGMPKLMMQTISNFEVG